VVRSIGISVGTSCGNEMIMSYAKVQPPETCVHEVYLLELTKIDCYIGFYVYLSRRGCSLQVGSLAIPNLQGLNES
jgi:hypothetical protein